MVAIMAALFSSVADAFMFFLIFRAFMERKAFVDNRKIAAGVLLLSFFIFVWNGFFLYTAFNIVGVLIAAWLVSFLLYQGSGKSRTLATLFAFLLGAVIEILVTNLMAFCTQQTIETLLQNPEHWLFAILTAKISTLAVCNVFRVKRSINRVKVSDAYWVVFFVLYVNLIIILFLLFEFSYAFDQAGSDVLILLCSFCLLLSTTFALYLFEQQTRQQQKLFEQEQREHQLNAQLKYLEEVQLKQKSLRAYRHDILNYFLILKGYFEKNDPQGGVALIDQLTHRVKNTFAAIDTGNIALDAILSSKVALAESKGIKVNYRLQIAENLPLTAEEICAIFGNALDNAIEACERLKEGSEKWVSFTLMQEDETLICKMQNSAPNTENRQFLTVKSDKINHGIGLNNLREALENYENMIDLSLGDGVCTLYFMIYFNANIDQ